MDRAHFDNEILTESDPHGFLDRFTGKVIELSQQDFSDLSTIHLCDWLEQVSRSNNWGYRRPVYRKLAERLGAVALSSYDAVYQNEPV
jgi:lipopolysaccharide biosynthesis protein